MPVPAEAVDLDQALDVLAYLTAEVAFHHVLAFDDRAAAQDYVNAVQVNPNVMAAAVYDENQITSPQSGLACVASPIISFLPLPHPSYLVPPAERFPAASGLRFRIAESRLLLH